MIRFCLSFAVLVLGFSFISVNAAEEPSVVPDDVSYSIISDQNSGNTKRMVEVRLNRRVSEDVLFSIAESIRSSDSTVYDMTFMTYYLPDMKVGAGAWATTHYRPELEVTIIGLTEEEYSAMQDPPATDSQREIIGTWFYESIAARKLVLYRGGDELTMESTFKDGSVMTEDLVEKKKSRRGRRLDAKETSSFGEYYVIAKNGNLEMWDSEGLIGSAKKQKSK